MRYPLAALAAMVFSAFFWGASLAETTPITLKSTKGEVTLQGDYLGFDGDFIRLNTEYGVVTVRAKDVTCEGAGCPDLKNFTEETIFSGAPQIGRVLLPALIEAFAVSEDLTVQRDDVDGNQITFQLSAPKTKKVLAHFSIRLNSTTEGFSDLIQRQADVVMALRKVNQSEIEQAKETGLGNLARSRRVRTVGVDGLVPVVSAIPTKTPDAPDGKDAIEMGLSLEQLAQILSGKIKNWSKLSGPDAPIKVHIWDVNTGIGQAIVDHLLTPFDAKLSKTVVQHPDGESLLAAVKKDPAALGITAASTAADVPVLAIRGTCGLVISGTLEEIKAEDYPLITPLSLYMPEHRLGPISRRFFRFIKKPKAQKIIERAGIWDLMPTTVPLPLQGERLVSALKRADREDSVKQLEEMITFLKPLQRLSVSFRFEEGSTNLDGASQSSVQLMAEAITEGFYHGRRLVLVGFSDGVGDADKNQELSLKRAEVVRGALMGAMGGVARSKVTLETAGFGEISPIVCDEDDWGRQINRRVEMWVE